MWLSIFFPSKLKKCGMYFAHAFAADVICRKRFIVFIAKWLKFS